MSFKKIEEDCDPYELHIVLACKKMVNDAFDKVAREELESIEGFDTTDYLNRLEKLIFGEVKE